MNRTHLIPLVLMPLWAFAQEPIPADDAVLERINALSNLPWLKNDPFTTDVAALNIHGFLPTDTPSYAPEIIGRRLALLDQRTPFKLTYNAPVQSFIDLYGKRKREQTERMLGLAELYFPVFEEALDRYNLPQELKYLSVVESALYPGAKSRASAVGLWQFMIGTGKLYGLHVDSYVDERCDVYRSTDAACRYLRDLHRIFGNWELALAAYNCGPGNVNKAVRRAGGTMDYWAIYDYLPRETRGYVPAFIAVNYIFAHAADHNLYPLIPNYCAYEVDTVQVCYPVSLDKLAEITGGSAQELRDLNPVFKQGIVPDLETPSTLYVPRTLVADFIDRENAVKYSYVPDMSTPGPMARNQSGGRASTERTADRVHVVQSGESLGTIARKNHVTVGDLRSWNNLHNDHLRTGQKLVLHTAAPKAQAKGADAMAREEAGKHVEYIYHTIQAGDTLWEIAQRYPGTTVEEIRRINDEADLRHLTIGQKIKVGVQKG